MRFLNKMNKAVTLTEVLTVVIISAILAAVAFTSYRYFVEKAKDQEAIAVLKTIAAAEIVYLNENRVFFASDPPKVDEQHMQETLRIKFPYTDWQYCLKLETIGSPPMYRLAILAKRTSSRPFSLNPVWMIDVWALGGAPGKEISLSDWVDYGCSD